MKMTELLGSIQYVTDHHGKKKGVLLDLEVWQELVQLVEQKTTSDLVATIENNKIEKEQIEAKEVEHVEDTKREAAMLREEAAFRRLHPSLYNEYAGKYVAIYNEQLIDSDSDQVALYRRVRKQHPGEFIWIAPVNESPDEVLFFRSPRILNGYS